MTTGTIPVSGTEIRSFRKKNRLSQAEFAELVGVSMRAVQLWESGDRNVSSLAERTIKEVFAGFENRGGIRIPEPESDTLGVKAPLFTTEAFARYLDEAGESGISQPTETVNFVLDRRERGNFVAFRVSGDSMNGGYIDDTPDRAIVLGLELPRDLWRMGFPESRYGWIIVSNRNVLFKDIIDFDKETANITCHSRNDSPEYSDFNLSLNDVHKIFKVLKRAF